MSDPKAAAREEIARLIDIMAQLRDPDYGCPWDLEQDFTTIAPYTIEEAYEVADAIERGAMDELKSELGDLLFQTIFHSRLAEEQDAFAFADVVRALNDKMIRRHPHVFGNADSRDAAAQTLAWEEQKAQERAARGSDGILDDVPTGLPGLTRAVKLQKRAARVGFDWRDAKDVLSKLTEETTELVAAQQTGTAEDIEEEFGDLLFVMANLARHLKVDPEKALRRTNQKFINRFAFIEDQLRQAGKPIEDATLEEMDRLWEEAKRTERK